MGPASASPGAKASRLNTPRAITAFIARRLAREPASVGAVAPAMEPGSILPSVRALLHTEFAALLARAGVSQAAFARLSGVTPRQVNKWARGQAAVPRWAALLAALMEDTAPEALLLMLADAGRHPAQLPSGARRPLRRRQGRHPPGDAGIGPALPPRQGRPAGIDGRRQRRLCRRRIIVFSTATAMATTPSCTRRLRARSLGPIRCLYLDIAVSA